MADQRGTAEPGTEPDAVRLCRVARVLNVQPPTSLLEQFNSRHRADRDATRVTCLVSSPSRRCAAAVARMPGGGGSGPLAPRIPDPASRAGSGGQNALVDPRRYRYNTSLLSITKALLRTARLWGARGLVGTHRTARLWVLRAVGT